MLPELTIDLGTPPYWFAVLAAVIVIVPLVHGTLRAIVVACFDLSFACVCAGTAGTPFVVGLVAGIYLYVWLIRPDAIRRTTIAVVVIGGALLVLFVAHKLPSLELPAGARGALSAIGFSYVVLRAVELMRAVVERRHPPPRLDEVISYLLPFHMLAAGPIQAYDEFRGQPKIPDALTWATALGGLERIASGLFKKFVIAQAIQEVLLTGFTAHGPYLVVEAHANYLWLYLDFSAYSDIAVGIGILLGRATPENFANPLAARNLTEFWERWHISLSQFVRRNLFIPIQLALGRRTRDVHPLLSASVAIAISFLLVGLWHGLSLRFLAWGGLHAVGLVATNVYKHALHAKLGRKGVKAYLGRRSIRVIATVLTFELVAGSLVLVSYPF